MGLININFNCHKQRLAKVEYQKIFRTMVCYFLALFFNFIFLILSKVKRLNCFNVSNNIFYIQGGPKVSFTNTILLQCFIIPGFLIAIFKILDNVHILDLNGCRHAVKS